MLRINEESKWEDEVPLLTRADKVEGGILGASNQQAIILANRTRKLKDDFDSAMDYREYTFYITPDDPDGTIAGIAGTPEGKGFRVAVQDAAGVTVVYKIYRNVAGRAIFINAQPSDRYIEELKIKAQSDTTALYLGIQTLIAGLAGPNQDIAEQLQALYLGFHSSIRALDMLSALPDELDNLTAKQQSDEDQLQAMYTAFHSGMRALSLLSAMPDDVQSGQLNTLYALSALGSQLMPLDGIDPSAKGDQSGQLATLMAFSVLGNALLPLEGFNPASSGGGSGDAGSPLRYPGIYAFGEPRGLVRIDLTSPSGAPTSKDDAIKGSVRIDIDGEGLC